MNSGHVSGYSGLVTDKMLSAFGVAARTGSFTAAAAALQISQSGISHAVSKPESALGYQLFERSKSGAELTVRGSVLHAAIKVPLADIDRAISQARRPERSPAVELSVSTSRGYTLYPPLLYISLRWPTMVK
jgi:DNA-binding transcriptional LysR family regulator